MADEIVSSTDQFGNPIFQVQSDWVATNPKSASFIRNKPVIAPQIQSDWAQTDNTRPDYIKNKSVGGGVPQVNSDWNASSGVAQILNKPIIVPTTTCMPTSNSIGIKTDGTDQTAALNAAFLNSNYSGIILDFSPAANIVVNGAVNCQGKTLKFAPGNTISGTYTFTNFILDCGLRQKCFDIGSSGAPTGTIAPIGTTLSVISPWVFGARDNNADCSRFIQATMDTCIKNLGVSVIYVPSGRYVINNPLIEYNWNSGYSYHQISIIGEASASQASSYGTYFIFSARNNSFGIGIQAGKGSKIQGIAMTGGFNYSFPGAYTFYNTDIASFTDGSSRDTNYSPHSGIVIDPFGPTVPADGGWPGNDAYGNALSTYYRGSTSGSTGVEIDNVYLTNWVMGVITSPNGQTANAELLKCTNMQIANMKIGFCGCQAQEKLNIIKNVESWGVTHTIFATGLYGVGSHGSWKLDQINIAGYSNTLANNSQAGYFPSFYSNIYAESLGTIGPISSANGTVVRDSTFNFATYDTSGSASYQSSMVQGGGVTYIGCQFRLYGTGNPVTIGGATTFPIHFESCAFDTIPIYTQSNASGFCSFSSCTIGDVNHVLNPVDIQTMQSSLFGQSFSYGNIRVKAGTNTFNIKSNIAAAPLPVIHTITNYTVTISVVSGIRQATITCVGDELNRVLVGDKIVAQSTTTYGSYQVLGIVSAAGGGTFTVKYIPAWVVSGNSYYLFVWLPLKNIAISGTTTSGAATITSTTIVAGSASDFVSSGGLLKTAVFSQTDSWGYNMLRLTNWNAGTSTFTADRNCNASLSSLFINTDAVIEAPKSDIAAIGQIGLSSGINSVIIQGVTTNSTSQITLVSFSGGGLTAWYIGVCTANLLTISALKSTGALNAVDAATVNYVVYY